MDPISFSHADQQKQRIEKVIANPDSTSGVITVPKTIARGETVTVPAGRVAVLPNVQVDGTLNVEGEVFIPSGTTFSKVVNTEGNQTIAGIKTFSSSPIVPIPTTGAQSANKDYVDTKQSKSELAYNVDTSSYIPNTLLSGAMIERGSNANGEYIKYADGTLICLSNVTTNGINGFLLGGSTYYYDHPFFPSPATFITSPKFNVTMSSSSGRLWISGALSSTTTAFSFTLLGSTEVFSPSLVNIVAFGRWK